jgi:hypothetical protein
MEFHLFHSVNPHILIEQYGVISENSEQIGVPNDLKKYEIDFFPYALAFCHQGQYPVHGCIDSLVFQTGLILNTQKTMNLWSLINSRLLKITKINALILSFSSMVYR